MGFLGLDVLAIQHLARQLDTQASEVASAVQELSAVVRSTAWQGNDRQRFVEQWDAIHAPELRRMQELLTEAARLARASATEQDRVSR